MERCAGSDRVLTVDGNRRAEVLNNSYFRKE